MSEQVDPPAKRPWTFLQLANGILSALDSREDNDNDAVPWGEVDKETVAKSRRDIEALRDIVTKYDDHDDHSGVLSEEDEQSLARILQNEDMVRLIEHHCIPANEAEMIRRLPENFERLYGDSLKSKEEFFAGQRKKALALEREIALKQKELDGLPKQPKRARDYDLALEERRERLRSDVIFARESLCALETEAPPASNASQVGDELACVPFATEDTLGALSDCCRWCGMALDISDGDQRRVEGHSGEFCDADCAEKIHFAGNTLVHRVRDIFGAANADSEAASTYARRVAPTARAIACTGLVMFRSLWNDPLLESVSLGEVVKELGGFAQFRSRDGGFVMNERHAEKLAERAPYLSGEAWAWFVGAALSKASPKESLSKLAFGAVCLGRTINTARILRERGEADGREVVDGVGILDLRNSVMMHPCTVNLFRRRSIFEGFFETKDNGPKSNTGLKKYEWEFGDDNNNNKGGWARSVPGPKSMFITLIFSQDDESAVYLTLFVSSIVFEGTVYWSLTRQTFDATFETEFRNDATENDPKIMMYKLTCIDDVLTRRTVSESVFRVLFAPASTTSTTTTTTTTVSPPPSLSKLTLVDAVGIQCRTVGLYDPVHTPKSLNPDTAKKLQDIEREAQKHFPNK